LFKDLKKSRQSEGTSNGSSAKRARKSSQEVDESMDDVGGLVNHSYRKAATTSLLDRPSNVMIPVSLNFVLVSNLIPVGTFFLVAGISVNSLSLLGDLIKMAVVFVKQVLIGF
jgi:hypothetical protein